MPVIFRGNTINIENLTINTSGRIRGGPLGSGANANAGRSGTYSEDFNGGSNANSNSINDAHGPANRLVITSHGPRNRDLIQDYFPRNLIQNHLDHFSGLFSRASAFTAHHPNLQNGFAPPHYHSRGTAFVTSSISSQVSTSGGQAALSFMSSQMSYESTSQTSVLGFAQASSTSSTLHTTSSGARGSGASQPSITINVYESRSRRRRRREERYSDSEDSDDEEVEQPPRRRIRYYE